MVKIEVYDLELKTPSERINISDKAVLKLLLVFSPSIYRKEEYKLTQILYPTSTEPHKSFTE